MTDLDSINHVKYPKRIKLHRAGNGEMKEYEDYEDSKERLYDIAREIIRFCAGEELTILEFRNVLHYAECLAIRDMTLKAGYPM